MAWVEYPGEAISAENGETMETIIGDEGGLPADLIKDATVETFEQDVITASMEAPIIVDFWAEWCGPCKQLAPMIERAVMAAGGKVRLVKIDIDKNQMLASQLRIQSIPTVYAFFQGRPVDGFQGGLPESEIKTFIDRLVEMGGANGEAANPAEDYLSAGEAALAEGDVAAAAQLFGQVAQAEPENLRALAGLVRCELSAGETERAKQTFELIPADKRTDPLVSGLEAAITLAGEGGGDVAASRSAAEAAPDDLQARFDYARALLGSGAMEAAIDELLAIIEKDRDWNEGAARAKLLTVFEALGGGDPVTLRGRRRLSSILFS